MRDLTERLERLEAFEERLGVRLDALSALQDDVGYISVRGELHPTNGTTLDANLELVTAGYDRAGRIVANGSAYIMAESFYGFDTFSIMLMTEGVEVVRLRIYPKG